MAKHRPPSEANAGKAWTRTEVRRLRELAAGNTPTRVIGLKLLRPAGGVQQKASEKGISLRPPNQRPYGTTKRQK